MKCGVLYLLAVAALLVFSRAAVAASLSQSEDGQFLTIQAGEKNAPDHRIICKYHFGGVSFKPYMQELYSPAGFNVLRDNVPDHIHHHGLMFAVAVDGVDFWAETDGCGKELHSSRSFNRYTHSTSENGKGAYLSGFKESVDWISPAKETLLCESRDVRVRSMENAPVTFLIWRSTLALPPGKITATLTGSHYFGLGMRFPQSMDAIGRFFNEGENPGELVRGEERNVQSDWCAYTAEVAGKPVTVAMFGRPSNIRPTTWFTMPVAFAYMSATLNLHKQPLTISAGKPLDLAYAVAVWDAKATKEEINKLYQQWIALKLDEEAKPE